MPRSLLFNHWTMHSCRSPYVAVPETEHLQGSVIVHRPSEPWHRYVRSSWWDANAEVVMEHPAYQSISGIAILMNAIVIGCETDAPDLLPWDVIEALFLVFFAGELGFRVYAFTPEKFFGATTEELAWNLFDVAVVGAGVFDTLNSHAHGHGEGGSFTTVFRLFRLARIMRLFKLLRFVRPLYLLAHGFVEGVIAVFWVTLMTTFVLYVCAVIIVRCYSLSSEEDHPDYQILARRFNTIPQTMFTLFELMSNPDLTPYHALVHSHLGLWLFFIGFIIFGSFGMIALLTGVISESMFEKNQVKIQQEGKEREEKRARFRAQFGDLFDTLDADCDGVVSKAELQGAPQIMAKAFATEGLHIAESELDNMFKVLDIDGSGFIDRDEFVHGTVQLSDAISPLSIMELHASINQCCQTSRRTEGSLSCLIDSVAVLQSQVLTLLENNLNTKADMSREQTFLEPPSRTSFLEGLVPHPALATGTKRHTPVFLARRRSVKGPHESVMPFWQKVQDDLSSLMTRVETSHREAIREAASMAKQRFDSETMAPLRQQLDLELSSLMSRIEASHSAALRQLRGQWATDTDATAVQAGGQQPTKYEFPMLRSSFAEACAHNDTPPMLAAGVFTDEVSRAISRSTTVAAAR